MNSKRFLIPAFVTIGGFAIHQFGGIDIKTRFGNFLLNDNTTSFDVNLPIAKVHISEHNHKIDIDIEINEDKL